MLSIWKKTFTKKDISFTKGKGKGSSNKPAKCRKISTKKKAALEAAIAKRKLTAEEWKTTLATFKTRRAEIAKLLKEHREQIASNNQKLADKISEDRNNIAKGKMK